MTWNQDWFFTDVTTLTQNWYDIESNMDSLLMSCHYIGPIWIFRKYDVMTLNQQQFDVDSMLSADKVYSYIYFHN